MPCMGRDWLENINKDIKNENSLGVISNKKDTKIFTLYPNYPVSKIIIKH
jgi:hypothetical protein